MKRSARQWCAVIATVSVMVSSGLAMSVVAEEAEATYTWSADPTKLVLFISRQAPAAAHKTIALYGDGKLVYKSLEDGTVMATETHRVSTQEIRRVLDIAVDHGLVEMDGDRMLDDMRRHNNGKEFSAAVGSEQVIILLSLTSYEKGQYRKAPMNRTLLTHGYDEMARSFPPIPEIAGVVELQRALRQIRNEL